MTFGLDGAAILNRLVKYLIEGLAVGLAAFYLPSVGKGKGLKMETILMLSLTAASTFAIIDLLMPSISGSMYTGTGLYIGAKAAGFR